MANGDDGHEFGGDWTTAKLEVLRRYLIAYNTALQNTSFTRGYIDAFAGTGYRSGSGGDDSQVGLFPDLAGDEPQGLLDGSARIALQTQPRFHRYVFIERRASRCEQLERLGDDFPELANDIQIRQGDANAELRDLCSRDWSRHRAVLFLDPYGMQVEWETLEAVASTKAIDMWLLFPLGIGINRLLPRSGEVPQRWRERLDVFLGTRDWYDEFYQTEEQQDMFRGSTTVVSKARVEAIGNFFMARLEGLFEGVVEPAVLENSTRCPLYLLCFAAANQRGAPIATRIARNLLDQIR